MIIPVGQRVLVRQEKYDEHDEVFASAKAVGIEIVKDREVRYQASVDVGTIVSVGKGAWKDYWDGTPWAEVGDKVVFAKNSGKTVVDPENEDTPFVVLNDEDIVAILRG